MLRIPAADSEQARRQGRTVRRRLQGASWGAEGKLFRREQDVRYNFTSPKQLQKYNQCEAPWELENRTKRKWKKEVTKTNRLQVKLLYRY